MTIPNLSPLYKAILESSGEKDTPTVKDAAQRRKPLIELIDVYQNGFFPFTTRLSKSFARVSRLIVFHAWDGTTLNYNEFMDGAAGQPFLVNGLQILVDGKELFPIAIHAMKDYMRYAFDTDFVIDTKGATKRVYFTARLSFHRFMGNREGISLREYDLEISFADNITAFGTNGEATWAFEGWGWDR